MPERKCLHSHENLEINHINSSMDEYYAILLHIMLLSTFFLYMLENRDNFENYSLKHS